jgi:hypothetical protein
VMKRFLRWWNRLGILHPSITGGEVSKSFVIFKQCRENESTADTVSVKPFVIRLVLDPGKVTWLRRLAIIISQQRPRSNLRQPVWGFVVDNLELELIFLQVFQPSFISVRPPKFDILSFTHSFIHVFSSS